ncbi:MAG TPA: cytochrome c-552 precursor [Rhodospirillaceae bacterium]|nr:cytochrome c-552 precursor [Rhodospirillaceae bacterium]
MNSSVRTALLMAAITNLAAQPTWAVEWDKIPGKQVQMFYPGQQSWEWVLSQGEHKGEKKFRDGKNCKGCHGGEEADIGATQLSAKGSGDTAGKPGMIAATVKFARESNNLFVRLDFAEGAQPDSRMDPKNATKVTIMLNDGKVSPANRAGCWAACHDDLNTMTSAGERKRTKYLGASRVTPTRQGGGDNIKPSDELAKLRAAGYYLEYWQALLSPGTPANSNAFTVLDRRETITPNAVSADATIKDGVWSVTLNRPLHAGEPYKDIEPGKPYTVGFAIHSGHSAARFHYVSFEYSLAFDQGGADFIVQ